jgi:hypothetical protein
MKSQGMKNFLDGFTVEIFGMSRSEAIKNGVCVICQTVADNFHDDISEREFKISGMCQNCQDDAYGMGDD